MEQETLEAVKKKKKKMGEGCSKNPKTYLMLFSIFALIIPSLSHTQTHTHRNISQDQNFFFLTIVETDGKLKIYSKF